MRTSFIVFLINENFKGGWVGFKELMVTKKEKESKNVTSFYFGHTDGTKIPDNFKPGQYIAIKVPSSAFGAEYDHDMCRNYSVSCAPGQGYLRCSIGRSIDQSDPDEIYHGIVSNYMHDQISQGDKVLVGLLVQLITVYTLQNNINRIRFSTIFKKYTIFPGHHATGPFHIKRP